MKVEVILSEQANVLENDISGRALRPPRVELLKIRGVDKIRAGRKRAFLF